MEQLTSKETMREWLSTIPEQGDTKALTHCSSGSICIASDLSIILRPSTPFSIPHPRRCLNFGISVNVVATISLPICLCGITWSEQYLYNISLPLTQRFAWNTFQIKIRNPHNPYQCQSLVFFWLHWRLKLTHTYSHTLSLTASGHFNHSSEHINVYRIWLYHLETPHQMSDKRLQESGLSIWLERF